MQVEDVNDVIKRFFHYARAKIPFSEKKEQVSFSEALDFLKRGAMLGDIYGNKTITKICEGQDVHLLRGNTQF